MTPSTTLPHPALAGFAPASAYNSHRPSYSSHAVSALLRHLQLDNAPRARILDLGAGTGKFRELLAAREEGYEILAVEPHARMRGELEAKGLKGVRVLEGGVGDLSRILQGEEVEGVVVAQAFHWFANEEALQDIYKVLAPGSSLGMIWNIEDSAADLRLEGIDNAPKSWTPTTTWESKLKDIIWKLDDNSPRFRHEAWRKVFDDQLRTTPFTIQSADPLFSLPLGEESEKFTHWLNRDDVWERFHTLSQIAVLEGEELEVTKRKVFEAMDGEDVEKNEKGELALHGHTVWYWTTAIPGAPLREGG